VRRRTVEKLPDTPLISASHDRKLQAAIERVFRLTHGREMTAEEKRLFGLAGRNGPGPHQGQNSRNDGSAAKGRRK